MEKCVVVLAAGKGTRMKSLDESHSKIAYPIMGKPILEYVLDALEPLKFKKRIVVAGFGGDITKEIVKDRAQVIQEKERHESGSSAYLAKELLKNETGVTLLIYGDLPLLTADTIGRLLYKHEKNGNGLTVLTSVLENPTGYARIIREHKTNLILEIKEEKDLDEYQQDINEVNAGAYAINNDLLLKYLDNETTSLNEIVGRIVKDKIKVEAYVLEDPQEMYSISNRAQLAFAARIIRKRVNLKLMLSGVSIEDPDTTYISPDIEIGVDTIIMPNTTILGKSKIGKGNWLGPNTYINNAEIGDNNKVHFSWIDNVKMGNNNEIGPFAKIYKESELGNDNNVGNFVELKKTKLSNGVFAKHLSYLGDAKIGDKTNVGCMTVTCNYDGVNKHETIIGNNVFVGTGSILIAPVELKDDSFVAAGTVVTKNVNEDELAIGRVEQNNVPHGSSSIKKHKKG